jgi:hypothetical protein
MRAARTFAVFGLVLLAGAPAALAGTNTPVSFEALFLILFFTILAAFVLIIAGKVLRAVFGFLFPPTSAERNARVPGPVHSGDLRTMVLYYGRNDPKAGHSALFDQEIARQVQEETARKQHFASVAIATLQDSGKIYVQLHRASAASELLWHGLIGEVPHDAVPSAATGPEEFMRQTESLVRAAVEAALA